MSEELEDFLRQAAERRKQRQQDKQARGPIAPPNSGAGVSGRPDLSPSSPRFPSPIETRSDVGSRETANRSRPNSTINNEAESSGSVGGLQGRRLTTQFDRDTDPLSQPTQSADFAGRNSPQSSERTKKPNRKRDGDNASSRPIASVSPTSLPSSPGGLLSPLQPMTAPSSNPSVSDANAGRQLSIAEQLRSPNALPLGTILVLGEILKRPWE